MVLKRAESLALIVSGCYRLTQEGLESIFGSIGMARKIEIPKQDLIKLLYCDDIQNPTLISSLSSTVQTQVETLSTKRVIHSFSLSTLLLHYCF